MRASPPQETSLFAPERRARARRTDPVTSFWAAQGVDVNRRQGMVLSAFIGLEKATQDDLIARARELYGDVAESTIRTGCSELEQMSPPLVEWSGEYGTSARGGKARLYRRVVR